MLEDSEGGREGGKNRTFKDVWGIYFFGVALFGHWDLVRDLDKVDAGGEIRDAARHDREELMTTTSKWIFVDYESERDDQGTKGLAFWISSWSWVMRSMLDSSSSIAV